MGQVTTRGGAEGSGKVETWGGGEGYRGNKTLATVQKKTSAGTGTKKVWGGVGGKSAAGKKKKPERGNKSVWGGGERGTGQPIQGQAQTKEKRTTKKKPSRGERATGIVSRKGKGH